MECLRFCRTKAVVYHRQGHDSEQPHADSGRGDQLRGYPDRTHYPTSHGSTDGASHQLCDRHRLSAIKNADLILVMKDGDIIKQETHESLLAKGGFYADLYNSQFEQASQTRLGNTLTIWYIQNICLKRKIASRLLFGCGIN